MDAWTGTQGIEVMRRLIEAVVVAGTLVLPLADDPRPAAVRVVRLHRHRLRTGEMSLRRGS